MVTQRNPKRLRFRRRERLFWGRLYPLWPGYLQTLHVFKADTLVRWHRKGFRLYWTWKARRRRRSGRRAIPAEVRALIQRMSQELYLVTRILQTHAATFAHGQGRRIAPRR